MKTFNKFIGLLNKYSYFKLTNDINIILKTAAKLDVLKKKFPHLSEDIEYLHLNDPTSTKKYLEWAVKYLDKYSRDKLADIIKKFDKNYQILDNKDINSYTPDKLILLLNNVEQSISSTKNKQQQKISGADKLYESNKFMLICPKTQDAVCLYGSNTKWCITDREDRYFDEYNGLGTVFYFIINKQANPAEDPMAKIAIAYNSLSKNSGLTEKYDAGDIPINESDIRAYIGIEYNEISGAIYNHNDIIKKKNIEKILNSDYAAKLRVAENPNTSPDILDYLANDKHSTMRSIIASHKNVFPNTLLRLSNDEDIEVRCSIANNYEAPPEALAILANTKDENILRALANNINTPSNVLDDLSKSTDRFIWNGLIYNSSTPTAALLRLSNIEDVSMCIPISTHINVSSEILANFANSKNRGIRILAAQNAKTPVESLKQLANDDREDIRVRVAFNSSSTPDILDILSRDTFESVRRMIAANENTSIETLKTLIYDPKAEVRMQIAYNIRTTSQILDLMCSDSEEEVRKLVASNTQTANTTLHKMIDDQCDLVKYWIARNINTSINDLIYLYQHNYSHLILEGILVNRNFPEELRNEVLKKFNNNISQALIKLANKLDDCLQIKIADEIDYFSFLS